jgi:hypothetical protein
VLFAVTPIAAYQFSPPLNLHPLIFGLMFFGWLHPRHYQVFTTSQYKTKPGSCAVTASCSSPSALTVQFKPCHLFICLYLTVIFVHPTDAMITQNQGIKKTDTTKKNHSSNF